MFNILSLIETDHDLLIQIITKIDMFQTMMTNHLHHHTIYTLALFTAFLSLCGGIILILFRQYGAKRREK